MYPGSKAVEADFEFNGFHYAGQLWGETGGLPVLALHGWMDNSGSFEVLAPLLKNVQLLAPDLAGHGYSDHRKGLSDYPVWSEIAELIAITDTMKWQRFAIIGHSRGAMMSTLLAAAFPERVSHLILLDAVTPLPVTANEGPERMVKSIQEIQRRVKRRHSCYSSFEIAIEARRKSEFAKITLASAEILASRGLIKLDEGYHWHADGKLRAFSNVGLTFEQINAFTQRISAKVLVLLGKKSIRPKALADTNFAAAMNSTLQILNAEKQEFDDGHYLHMEKAAEDVAKTIHEFLFR